MGDIVSSPPAPNIRKRPAPDHGTPGKKPLNLKGSQFMMPTPPDTDQSSNASPDVSIAENGRAASPAPSNSTLSSIVEVPSSHTVPSSSTVPGSSAAQATSSGAPPAKRRKLTPSEKLEKQKAKEAKEQERAEKKARQEEEKARKEEDKARKDEEKRVRDEEKRKKAEEREAKKREKEVEEERKAQEKLSKERSQMRLTSLFKPAATPAKSAAASKSANDEGQPRARSRSVSLGRYDDVADLLQSTIRRSASPAKGTPPPVSSKKPVLSKAIGRGYHDYFLPFEKKPHTEMPALPEYSEAAQAVFDSELKDPSLREQYDLGIVSSYSGHADIQHYFTNERQLTRGIAFRTARELVDMMQGTSQQVIDLTGDSKPDSAIEQLQRLPVKHIQFEQDVRPAYCGTYTKITSPRTIRRFRTNPELRARPDTNYDDDSEAEWEEPEEGDEEIGSEDGDDADSAADANDIDDFLDDENDDNKRKMITGELVPESTGLCWADCSGRISVVESIEVQEQPSEMHGMRMGTLIPGFSGITIDPFSASYWESSTSKSTIVEPTKEKQVPGSTTAPSSTMAPPRPPLQPRLNANGSPSNDLVGAAEGHKGPITTAFATQAPKRGPKPAPKTLSKEDLDEFKEAVVDSPLGKLELLKGLKARFPKLTNDVIKETLGSHFAAIGKGKADKRWVFVGGI